MKKFFSVLLIVSICFINIGTVGASYYLDFREDNITVARIIEIIDGEVFKVIDNLGNKPTEKIVRLIGVNTESNQEAFDYAHNHLLGKNFILSRGSNQNKLPVDRNNFEQVYLYLEYNDLLNLNLIEMGLAKVDDRYSQTERYHYLKRAEEYAKSNLIGIWNEDGSSFFEQKNRVNINTASQTQLMNLLEDTNAYMASRIINYRNRNPFNSIEEIKFADHLINHNWFNKNRDKISVVTNVKYANEYELQTLFPSASNQKVALDSLVHYRLFNDIKTIEDLKPITRDYSYFERFITLDNKRSIQNENIININTATAKEIVDASNLSASIANQIVDVRKHNYIYKNVSEILHFGTNVTSVDLQFEHTNFTAFTNINTASLNELISLFGRREMYYNTKKHFAELIVKARPIYKEEDLVSVIGSSLYNEVRPYIIVEDNTKTFININLASKDLVVGYLKLTEDEGKRFNPNVFYRNTNQLQFDYKKSVGLFSFYTNINTASKEELFLLHKDITTKIVEDIIAFRKDQPFTSIDELNYVFNNNNANVLFNSIRNYIVFY
ncbi:nuclease-like protein [Natranaerovirga pectinivora]|uniref:Nuclease-like protein n=1 Tax=Natranaerovirga pectinivora TaxID=682400 RepID=A0A4R3MKE9_9FIRM|nr:helix-hairpin-helix domain-containing protein [Natranaerovirga pectinivora]TCT14903.1 nuclease-like protein [Natranaerovirga pectinivora]